MIYTCAGCGHLINRRTYLDDAGVPHTDYEMKDVGKFVLFDHLPFCNQTCIEFYIADGRKKYPPDSPQKWKAERKLNRNRKKKKNKLI